MPFCTFSRKFKRAPPICMHSKCATKVCVCEQVMCDAHDRWFTKKIKLREAYVLSAKTGLFNLANRNIRFSYHNEKMEHPVWKTGLYCFSRQIILTKRDAPFICFKQNKNRKKTELSLQALIGSSLPLTLNSKNCWGGLLEASLIIVIFIIAFFNIL
jgi:hypothetical protein